MVLSDIDSRTATTTVTNSDGTTSVSGGLLSGDSAVRSLRSALVDAASLSHRRHLALDGRLRLGQGRLGDIRRGRVLEGARR
ncbi:hypothetical protein [Demequina litorisediminis]|uniref:Uncharacterized protein n=1 Tax=Demequina litorisediminis TaxID=1849022 RepID=A0ABQ6IES8_9MICO|nr:hypothetical protein [Demequina litorisediminis]GMA35671.1 hypothetical protein GCM10025876_18750 [Demequina litorisediminis]